MVPPKTPLSAFQSRRAALHGKLETPALLPAGGLRSRNYPANPYTFRAKSHFLYFIGAAIPSAVLLFVDGKTKLFVEPEQPGDALWDGPKPSLEALREAHGLDAVLPLSKLGDQLSRVPAPVATLPTEDEPGCRTLTKLLGRDVRPGGGARIQDGTPDAGLADAMIALRLAHDDAAKAQLRWAADVTAQAHLAGMRATRGARTETEVWGAMMGVLRRAGHEDAYGPIVSTHGEVLHNVNHASPIAPGDLLLADVGGETPEGWAGDITRVWPVSGTFSESQRAIYEIVLDAEERAVQRCRKGVRYRDVHETAKRAVVEGLRELGVFRGDVDGLLERGAAALFFPHGVGHLLGMDVHDMEDLGDRAGYARGRSRSVAFGDCYLRLDRDLAPGMAVTIEPGFYQVPAILNDERYTAVLGADLRRDVLAKYGDVRGIRIEDDVLITDGEPEVMTRAVPKKPSAVEEVVQSG